MPTLSEADNAVTPERAGADWPRAVIAGAYQTGVLGVRALKRRGVEAHCFDCHTGHPGFTSVYGPAHACPDPDKEPDAWVAFMQALAAKVGGKPVLIASADQFVSAIAKHAAVLRQHYVLSSGVEVQGALATKETQYALAAEHGMPLPLTQQIATEADAWEFARRAMYPALIKPIHFREWQAFPDGHPLSFAKIAIVQSPEAFVERWRLAAEVNPNTIGQEIIQGPDTAKRVYVGIYDETGRRIGNAMFRELRCDPVGFGPATVSEPVVDEATDSVCNEWLQRIGYRGICEIEMKWDSRDNRVKIIEANPRLTGGGDAAPYAGVDSSWLQYLALIGQPVAPVKPNGLDFRHVVVQSDLAAVVNYRRAGLLSWRELRQSWKGPLKFYDLDRRDWRYSLDTLKRMARSAVKAIIRPPKTP